MTMLWVMGAATVIFAGVLGYGMTRRYGWGLALLLPLLALGAMLGMRWQTEGLTFGQGMDGLLPTLAYVSPVLLGVVIGIVAARLTGR